MSVAPSGAINYLKQGPAASGLSGINLTSVKPAKPTYQAPAPEEIKTTNSNNFDNYQDNSLGGSIGRLSRESVEVPAPVKPVEAPIAAVAETAKPALMTKLSTKLKDRVLDEVEYNAYAGDGFELDSEIDRADTITKPVAAVSNSLNRL